MDGRTDSHEKLTVALHSFANAPKDVAGQETFLLVSVCGSRQEPGCRKEALPTTVVQHISLYFRQLPQGQHFIKQEAQTALFKDPVRTAQ